MNAVGVTDLTKTYANATAPAVDGVSLEVNQGEIVSLLGPSGCGKTTTLRCIAGLETADSGQITLEGTVVVGDVGGRRRSLPPEQRGVSMVFQNYALWPHMTVWENVAYGLRLRTKSKDAIESAVNRALDMVKLGAVRDRRISQLSGGQQQRIALARALAFEPKIVLFDEPLSNLDTKLRDEMRLELLQLQRELGFSAVYVTHDQQEATGLSNRIIIMKDGHIEQEGTPQEIWESPATAFVVEFLGQANRIEGKYTHAGSGPGTAMLLTDFGPAVPVAPHLDIADNSRVATYIGYDRVEIRPENDSSVSGSPEWFAGDVKLVSYRVFGFLVQLSFGSGDLMCRTETLGGLQEGDRVWIRLSPDHFRCFASPANDRIGQL